MKPRAGAPDRAPTYEDLAQIVELLRSTSRFSEFRLRSGDIEVEVKRANGLGLASEPVHSTVPKTHQSQSIQTEEKAELPELPADVTVVRAPMMGTFYSSPEPGAPPFVEPGRRVAADATVCIIEVMKLMNTIPAGCAGTVTHVLVKNGAAVEHGQPLIAIRPDA